MPSSVQWHLASFPGNLGFAALEYHYLPGLSPARRAPSMHKKAGLLPVSTVVNRPLPGQVLMTLRCAGELLSLRPSSDAIAASTPPARCGTPAAARPISTPDKAPVSVNSLHSPRWPMRNTFPASLDRPEPSDMLYLSSAT